jgi:son of sevenless-like protein
MAIVSALGSNGVFRLKQTWSGISSHHRAVLEELRKAVSRDGNFRNLRASIAKANPPCIPYIGQYGCVRLLLLLALFSPLFVFYCKLTDYF